MGGRRFDRSRGQALVEFALVFPIAMMLLFGAITLGLWVFYQQQLTNAAREAARYAAIHSSTAPCPTVSWRDPQAPPLSYYRCDRPDVGWPDMVAAARASVWGVSPSAVQVNACWSGYVDPSKDLTSFANYSEAAGFPRADDPAAHPTTGTPNRLIQCKIGGVDPILAMASLGCAPRLTTKADDPASSEPGNVLTAYACFEWSPPLAGFLFLPSSVTMRAVISEVIQRQQ